MLACMHVCVYVCACAGVGACAGACVYAARARIQYENDIRARALSHADPGQTDLIDQRLGTQYEKTISSMLNNRMEVCLYLSQSTRYLT